MEARSVNEEHHYLDQFESFLKRREQAADISVSVTVEIEERQPRGVPDNFWAGADGTGVERGVAAH
jgi:hypothetical protein